MQYTSSQKSTGAHPQLQGGEGARHADMGHSFLCPASYLLASPLTNHSTRQAPSLYPTFILYVPQEFLRLDLARWLLQIQADRSLSTSAPNRTVRHSQPSQRLFFLTAIFMHVPILFVLFLLICMVCNSFNIPWNHRNSCPAQFVSNKLPYF